MKIKHIILILLILITALQTHADVHLIINNHQGTQGTQVTIPIRAKDFQDIISIQGTIEFNPAIISYISVQDFGLSGMNFNNFGTNQSANGIITFSWFDNLLNGNSVADSAVIFSLTFDVTGNLGQVSPLNFTNTPTVIEVINTNLQQENVVLANGSLTVQNLSGQQVVTLFTDTISAPANAQVVVAARVKDFTNINSFQGTLEFNPAIVSFAGFTGFGLPNFTAANFGLSQSSNGKLMFSWNDTAFAGIDLPDSTAVFSMLFNLVGNPGQQSPLAFINNPTGIELTDSLNNVLAYNLSNGFIQINNIHTDALTIKADTAIGPQGSQVDIPVRGIYFNSIVSMQGTIAFNTAIATFDTISYYGLPGMDFAHFGTTQINNGLLMYSWSDPSQIGISLADSSILFTMRLTLIGTPGSYTMLDFVNNPTPLECADNTLMPVNTQYISGKATVSGDASIVLDEATNNAYCAGDILSIPYTANGIFVAGNQFILQLSDAGGSFANPNNLDTITSVNSGVFNAQIPLNTPQGTAYLLRVISTNPPVISNETTNPITIHDIPATPLEPSGDVLLCENPPNTSYTTYSVQGALTYNWVIFPAGAGVLTVADTLATVDWDNGFSGSAYIKVSASNSLCTGAFSDSLEVVILAYPDAPDIPSGDTLLCLNPANSTYTVNAVPNATNYVWTLFPPVAGVLTPSGNMATVDWDDTFTGTAYIKVLAENGLCSGLFSDSLRVDILPYPGIPDKPTGDTLLCINPPDNLYSTNTVSGATSYVWELFPANSGTLTSFGTSVMIDWNSTFFGTANLKVKALNQICESAFSDVLHIDVVSPFSSPNKPFGGDTAFCINPPDVTYYTNAMQGATGYIWGIYPPIAGSLNSTDTIVSINWDDAFTGTVYLFVSATNGVCNGMNSDSLIVNIYPIPAPPTVGDTSVCFGLIAPSITAGGTGTIQWYDNCIITPPAIYTGNTYSPAHTAVGSYTYCVSQTINGCESQGTPVSFTIKPIPPAPVSDGDKEACFGYPVPDLSVTASGTVYWYNNPGLVNYIHIGQVFPTGQTAPGVYVYYVNQEDNGCESDVITVTLTIHDTPPAPVANDVDVCFGDPTPDLTATGSNLEWYSDNLLTVLVHTGNNFQTGHINVGVYTYYVIQKVNNCQSAATTVTLTIHASLPPPTANNKEACEGSIIPALTASGSGTIKWYDDVVLSNLVHTGAIFNTTQTLPGTYTYYATQSIGSCISTSTTVSLTIHPAPSAPVSGGNQQACFGQAIPELTASGTDTIKWYSDAGLTNLVQIGNSFATGHTAVGTYDYHVIQTNSYNCSCPAVVITLTIFAIPPAPFASDTSICFGTPTPDLTASGTGTFLWYDNCNLIFSPIYTGQTFSPLQTQVGSYTYCVTQSLNGCESPPTQATLHIHPMPDAPNKPAGDTLICQINTSTYTTHSVSNTSAYNWQLNPAAAGTLNVADTTVTIDWTIGFTGTVFLSVYASNQYCTSIVSDSLQIVFAAYPQQATKPQGDTIICEGSSTSVYTSLATGADTYNWVLEPQAAGYVSGLSHTVDVNWTQGFTGQAILYVYGSNLCGEGIVSDSLYIQIMPTPSPPVITANVPVLSSDYTAGNQWYFNGATIPNATDDTLIATQNGHYHVIYTDANGCYISSDTILITTVSIYNLFPNIVQAYPNPVSDKLIIEANSFIIQKIEIYSITGKLVFRSSVKSTNIEVDLSLYHNGFYILKVYFENFNHNIKLIKN